MCDCEFTPYKDSDEESWHFLRVCEFCGHEWYGLHCPHDGYQNPCPECDKRPTTVIYRKENKMTENKSVFDCKFKEQAQIQAMYRCDETLRSLKRPREALSDPMDEIWYRKWETLLDHQIAKFVCLFGLIWELHERIKLLEQKGE